MRFTVHTLNSISFTGQMVQEVESSAAPASNQRPDAPGALEAARGTEATPEPDRGVARSAIPEEKAADPSEEVTFNLIFRDHEAGKK